LNATATVAELLTEIKVIDVDTHVIEPYDLWTSRISVKKWGDKVPVLLDGERELCHYHLDIEAVDARLARMK